MTKSKIVTETTDKVENHVYKFNRQSTCTLDELKNSQVYQVMDALCKGIKPDKKLLHQVFDEFWHPATYKYGYYRLMGWLFDFTSFEKKFVVKTKLCGWEEIQALNKTMIRECSAHKSHILRIIELD